MKMMIQLNVNTWLRSSSNALGHCIKVDGPMNSVDSSALERVRVKHHLKIFGNAWI